MDGPVREVVRLGAPPWPTLDPFLFCVHHLDHYPEGDARLGPRASLAGRDIGTDFSGRDGWSMYHGTVVPGFPQHPHRGFETVTYTRHGFVDHSDSLGATARYGLGDVQWLTAGGGIVHAEMFPLVDETGPNTTELFQIWLNLPAARKMADPYFTMLWAEDVPVVRDEGVAVTVIAGALSGVAPLAPPPDSWAAQDDADVAIWHLAMARGASFPLPAARAGTARMLYMFEGALTVGGEDLPAGTGAVVGVGSEVAVTAGTGGAEVLVLQGRPIGEPVAQYGPFVMNDRAGIEQAFADYQRTGFGGWPWERDDPVHPRAAGRFARHPDGRLDAPAALSPARG
jgi:redox-sensitive bicupin YhaK (pirin superfamily)